MTTATKPLSEIAAHWREARKLYTIYSALLERFALGLPPCRDLESPIDRAEPEALKRIDEWFAQMDERVHVHQLRQLLQSSKLGTEEALRSLINRHLSKEQKKEADRDKIDFLLVQYLSSSAPPGFYEGDVSFDQISQVLEPVLGEVGLHPPQWIKPLDDATNALDSLRSLRDLLEQGTLDQMRKLKTGAGEMYFGPTALVAITRFNFLVRRTFVRLIAADLHAIRFSIHELEQRRVKVVDCSRAGLGSKEPLENLRQICHEWKKPFRAAYAAGQNFKELIEIRTAVEEALVNAPEPGAIPEEEPAPEQAVSNGMPASPAAEQNAASSGAAEFSVTQPGAGHAPVHPAGKRIEVEHTTPAPVHKPAAAATKAAGLVDASHVETPGRKEEGHKKHEAHKDPRKEHAAPGHAGPKREPASAGSGPLDLQAFVEQIAQILDKNQAKSGSVANIVVSGVKLMLSSWEVAAYVSGGDETSDVLQRVVAARAVVVGALDQHKAGVASADVVGALKIARAESEQVQARIAAAKEAKDIDSAVNLAASNKRLTSVIDEAAKIAK